MERERTRIERAKETLAAAGWKAAVWTDHGLRRIYLNGTPECKKTIKKRGISAWIEFADPEEEGMALLDGTAVRLKNLSGHADVDTMRFKIAWHLESLHRRTPELYSTPPDELWGSGEEDDEE